MNHVMSSYNRFDHQKKISYNDSHKTRLMKVSKGNRSIQKESRKEGVA